MEQNTRHLVSLLADHHELHLVAAVARAHLAVVRNRNLEHGEVQSDAIARLRTLRR